jgi:glycosyltransferase involved in cell wall biosynthesis/diadenosine tetraphosphate (Ap4A) HIT family hydrolase
VTLTPSASKSGRFLLLPFNDETEVLDFLSSDMRDIEEINNLSPFLKKISGKYLLLINDEKEINIDKSSLRRLLRVAEDKQAGIVYSDFISREGHSLIKHPLIDYQQGSIRDDFKFGHLLLFSCAAVKSAMQKYGSLPSEVDVASYDLRLKISSDYELIHVPEFLYKVSVKKQMRTKISGRKTEAHFAYVVKENLIRQKKLEKIATNHLKRVGAYLPLRTKRIGSQQDDLQWKASIVIPVLDRKKTIADALISAMEQETDFAFNIIVVDNHSKDGTTEILKKFAAKYPHVHHIIPVRCDLGIGGCWNEAIHSPHCGRYVVQLDSDDLYSSPLTLQKIVNTLRRGRYAMVVGSYTIVNAHLKKIPPGLIAHKEWTPANGYNNLLRVNGMGAPRAFDSSIIRQVGFPNVSYGEDYAVALRITREYKIGRIYENLYLCRRWTDNTDARLSAQKQNRNDYYKDKLRSLEIKERRKLNKKSKELETRTFIKYSGKTKKSLATLCRNLYDSQKKSWPKFGDACRDLASVQTRELSGENFKVVLQYNSARAISSGAAVDSESIKRRPCFLCDDNLPEEQKGILYQNQYLILCNPAPIFKNHFTIVALDHEPQEIASYIMSLLRLAAAASPKYAVFYNGPACGASAPDHLHFQMVPANALPFLKESKGLPWVREISSVGYRMGECQDRSALVLESEKAKALSEQFLILLKAAQKILKTNDEPMVNVICYYTGNRWRLVVFLRRKHRPDSYFAENERRIFISPGAVDMAGVVITPLLDNYNRLDYNAVCGIYREVSLLESTMDSIINEL